jgi:hypothetical protein
VQGNPLSDNRWSEQDRAVRPSLPSCHSALDIQPVFLADIQNKLEKLCKVSTSLREQEKLQSLGMGHRLKIGQVAAV